MIRNIPATSSQQLCFAQHTAFIQIEINIMVQVCTVRAIFALASLGRPGQKINELTLLVLSGSAVINEKLVQVSYCIIDIPKGISTNFCKPRIELVESNKQYCSQGTIFGKIFQLSPEGFDQPLFGHIAFAIL